MDRHPRPSDAALQAVEPGAANAAGSVQCKNGGGQQRCVDRAGPSNGEGADGHAGWHLHDREQRIHARTSAFDSTGTPNTGSGVIDAVMPWQMRRGRRRLRSPP